MGSSLYYKLWLRNTAGTAWVELENFVELELHDGINIIGSMSAMVFATDSATQDLLKADRLFRVTTAASTNGTTAFFHNGKASAEGGQGFEVMTGFLDEPREDTKTSYMNNKPVVWQITGNSMIEKLGTLAYNAETTFNTTGGNIVTSLISQANSQAGSTVVVAGTLDTGPTASIRSRKDNFLGTLLDLASVGDTPNKFTYYIDVEHDSSFRPRINYLAPNNALYAVTNPFNVVQSGTVSVTLGSTTVTGSGTSFTSQLAIGDRIQINSNGSFYTVASITNNTTLTLTSSYAQASGSGLTWGKLDEGRIVSERTEARAMNIVDERDRIRNAVNITWGGHGTGTQQTETGFLTDTTSITAFSRRENIVYAPWIQNSTTATIFRATLLDTYKGGADGITRAEVVLASGQLFSAAFDAILGDFVGVEQNDIGIIQNRFLAYRYSQKDESLTITIGLPQVNQNSRAASTSRYVRQNYNAIQATTFTGTAITTPFVPDISFGGNSTSVALSSGGVTTLDINFGASVSAEAHIYVLRLQLLPASGTVNDGPIDVGAILRSSATGISANLGNATYTAILYNVIAGTGPAYSVTLVSPYASSGSGTLNQLRLTVRNKSPDFINVSFLWNLSVRPEHSVNLNHSHPV